MINQNRRSSHWSLSESLIASEPNPSSTDETDETFSSTFAEESTVKSLHQWRMTREMNFSLRPMQSRTGNDIMDCIDTSECSEFRVLDNEQTRELLQHYLDNSESVDNLKLYKINFRQCLNQVLQGVVDFARFLFVLCSSDNFWSTCLMVFHVVVGVFFYLILAVSAILITVVMGLHNAVFYTISKEDRERCQPENAVTYLSPSDIETLIIQPTKARDALKVMQQ